MKLLDNKKQSVDKVDFGIVEAGETKIIQYYLYNELIAEVRDIKIEPANKEVKIVKFPSKLNSKEEGLIELSWTPSIAIKKGLQTSIKVSGMEIYK